jgi:hypothetical protein
MKMLQLSLTGSTNPPPSHQARYKYIFLFFFLSTIRCKPVWLQAYICWVYKYSISYDLKQLSLVSSRMYPKMAVLVLLHRVVRYKFTDVRGLILNSLCVQTGSGAHSASCTVSILGTWRWPLTSIKCRGKESVEISPALHPKRFQGVSRDSFVLETIHSYESNSNPILKNFLPSVSVNCSSYRELMLARSSLMSPVIPNAVHDCTCFLADGSVSKVTGCGPDACGLIPGKDKVGKSHPLYRPVLMEKTTKWEAR